eukprot:TRINITY_DN2993_c0_g1_i2.p2 TRINITY_DN2993_c0_g1~~TRINITY_DN2993_c0_g1_i2.p2  ORF type:complete len:348 (-),score=109.40 TRINITY_DN2993_c0_g1_i2:87-1079(-)
MAYAYNNLASPAPSALHGGGYGGGYAGGAAPVTYAAPPAAPNAYYAAPSSLTYAAPPASMAAPLQARSRSIHSRSIEGGQADRGIDVEAVKAAAASAAESAQKLSFRHMVWAVYLVGAAMIVFAICALIYGGPFGFNIAHVCAILSLLCAAFLIGNASLFSSMLRLWHEIGNFKAHNAAFEDDIQEQAKTIKELQKTAAAFDEIQRNFGGDVQRAAAMVDDLRAATRSSIATNCKQLCRLYTDKEGRHRFLSKGTELDNTFQLFSVSFNGIVGQYDERIQALQDVLFASDKFKKDEGVDVMVLSRMMEAAVCSEDLDGVSDACQAVLDEQ